MLTNYTFVPFLLALNVRVGPEETSNYNAEYLFDFNQTTVVHREPLQTTQLSAALICQPYLSNSLYCFLQNITSSTTFTYQNVNVTEEVSRNHMKSELWFEIYFNERGALKILVPAKSDKVIISIIKDIANQFNLGGNIMAKVLNTAHFSSGFTVREKTPIGTCATKCNMNTLRRDHESNEDLKFQIIPLAMSEKFANQKDTRIRIEKDRQNCEYSKQFKAFLNGMQVKEYIYTMEIVNDNLKMSTTMGVQLIPRVPWNSTSGSLVFTEKMLLNLTNIRSPQTIAQNEHFSWTTITL